MGVQHGSQQGYLNGERGSCLARQHVLVCPQPRAGLFHVRRRLPPVGALLGLTALTIAVRSLQPILSGRYCKQRRVDETTEEVQWSEHGDVAPGAVLLVHGAQQQGGAGEAVALRVVLEHQAEEVGAEGSCYVGVGALQDGLGQWGLQMERARESKGGTSVWRHKESGGWGQ